MSFAQILGEERAVAIVRNALRQNRIPHAYLFVGPEGVGKRLCALTLAKALNCLSPPEPAECCERCPSCMKINSANHADVVVLEPEGEVIKIDQVRELQKRLRFRPLEGGRRIYILDQVHRLNEAASNALLKTLEEPPEETHWILITSRPHRLLPTILSRCHWVKFRSLADAHIEQILREKAGLPQAEAQFYASLAGGSASQAEDLSHRVGFEKRLEWLRAFTRIPQKETGEIFDACENFAQEEMRDLLELWKIWIRDLTVFKITGAEGGLINHDLQAEIQEAAGRYSFDRLDSLFAMITRMENALDLNINRQLALETLMLAMKKAPKGIRPSR
jgi:DNA polymerase-3 subunit delta'